MSLKIRGIDDMVFKLENDAKRASEGARFAMKDGAEKIAKLASDFAPEEIGNLGLSIKADMEKAYSKARAHFVVYVDESTPAEHPEKLSTAGKTVGDYAFYMHEGIIPGVQYKLGKQSLRKQADLGVVVGIKFLERAVIELEDEIYHDVEQNLNKRIGK